MTIHEAKTLPADMHRPTVCASCFVTGPTVQLSFICSFKTFTYDTGVDVSVNNNVFTF